MFETSVLPLLDRGYLPPVKCGKQTLPYLTLPYLTLPYLTLPYLTLPYLTLPFLTLPYLTLPYLNQNVGKATGGMFDNS